MPLASTYDRTRSYLVVSIVAYALDVCPSAFVYCAAFVDSAPDASTISQRTIWTGLTYV